MNTEQQGTVFWLTGLSGSGKTTIGKALTQQLRAQGYPVVFLDGDHLREIFGSAEQHEREQRLQISLMYAGLCKMLAAQQIYVVCATISLFHQVQAWNRKHITHYVEILIDVPIELLKQRDPKKIYSRASAGELSHVVGIDIAAEYPMTPDIVIKNDDNCNTSEAVTKIMEHFAATYME